MKNRKKEDFSLPDDEISSADIKNMNYKLTNSTIEHVSRIEIKVDGSNPKGSTLNSVNNNKSSAMVTSLKDNKRQVCTELDAPNANFTSNKTFLLSKSEISCMPILDEEIHQLSLDINKLSDDKFEHIVHIIQRHESLLPEFCLDEIENVLKILKPSTLGELKCYVEKYFYKKIHKPYFKKLRELSNDENIAEKKIKFEHIPDLPEEENAEIKLSKNNETEKFNSVLNYICNSHFELQNGIKELSESNNQVRKEKSAIQDKKLNYLPKKHIQVQEDQILPKTKPDMSNNKSSLLYQSSAKQLNKNSAKQNCWIDNFDMTLSSLLDNIPENSYRLAMQEKDSTIDKSLKFDQMQNLNDPTMRESLNTNEKHLLPEKIENNEKILKNADAWAHLKITDVQKTIQKINKLKSPNDTFKIFCKKHKENIIREQCLKDKRKIKTTDIKLKQEHIKKQSTEKFTLNSVKKIEITPQKINQFKVSTTNRDIEKKLEQEKRRKDLKLGKIGDVIMQIDLMAELDDLFKR